MANNWKCRWLFVLFITTAFRQTLDQEAYKLLLTKVMKMPSLTKPQSWLLIPQGLTLSNDKDDDRGKKPTTRNHVDV